MSHRFSVGQAVSLVPSIIRAAARGPYEVRRLMPESDRGDGDPSYRIKSIDESYERVAFESDLTVPGQAEEPVFRASSPYADGGS